MEQSKNQEEFEKRKLLEQLANLGYHSSGRKQRSDKGQSRGAIKKSESPRDKSSRLAVYYRIKQRVFNRDQQLKSSGGYGLFIEMDENSFYLFIPARYQKVGRIYNQVYQGRKIEHTVQTKKVQKAIDLEKYRFEAYKEQAVLNPTQTVLEKDWPELRQMLIIRYGMTGDEATQALTKRQINWEDLFCEFYYLSHENFWLWDYEHWRRDYSFVPTQALPENFVFDYDHSPGSDEFHPEWAYKANERLQQDKEETEQERQRKANQFIMNMGRRPSKW